MLIKETANALAACVVSFVLCAVAYPTSVWGLGQLLFPARANALGATASHPAPIDLVTASGGGLDPHISPEAARYQAVRVATARRLPVEGVRLLIERHIERAGAIIGAPPRVNVLKLNRAL